MYFRQQSIEIVYSGAKMITYNDKKEAVALFLHKYEYSLVQSLGDRVGQEKPAHWPGSVSPSSVEF